MSEHEAARLVRQVWMDWTREQDDPKPSWLVPWEELDEGQREVDRRIELAVAAAERERVTGLAGRLKTVLAQPVNGYLVDAVPFAALLDVLAAGAVHREERP